MAPSGLRGCFHTFTNALHPGGAAARCGAPAVPGRPCGPTTARELAVWVLDYLRSVKEGNPESCLILCGVDEHLIASDASVP